MPIGIDANWDPSDRAVEFSTGNMNQILAEEFMEDFDFWQNQFGVFSTMRINEDRNFTVSHIRSNPLLVQPHKACDWNPIGGLTFDHKEYAPCKAKINTEQCYDELFKSCFKHFLQWNEAQPVRFSAGEGARFFNLLVNVMMRSAVQGVKVTNTMGRFFDYDKVKTEFGDKVGTDIRKLFMQTVANKEICAGYMYLLKELGEKKDHANIDFTKAIDYTNKGIEGELHDATRLVTDCLPADLDHIYTAGEEEYIDIFGRTRVIMPIWFATMDWYKKIKEEYDTQDNETMLILNKKRKVTARAFQYRKVTKMVYYINGVPVYPVKDPLYTDKYLKGRVSALFLTTTGNIALGGSFNSIKSLSNPDMGLRVQMRTDNEEYGKFSVLGHMLIKNTVLNTDMVAGSVKYIPPV